jgi:hypothetical protein
MNFTKYYFISRIKGYLMDELFTGKAAREFSGRGRIEEWIHRFLCEEGNNVDFSEGLKKERRFYIGPLKMPLSLFERCCGPEENMKYRIDKGGFEWRVSEIRKRIDSGWDMPPLIINYSEQVFELSDGNHRYQAMLDSGYEDCDVIIWITEPADNEQFLELYHKYL